MSAQSRAALRKQRVKLAFVQLAVLIRATAGPAALAATPLPPGVVIDHVPKADHQYVGSPSIAVLPSGEYIASHDLFGPGSDRQTTRVFVSHDRGQTWLPQGKIKGQWWSTLFVHSRSLYIIGVSREGGALVIRRSGDAGRSWTSPRDSGSGVLSPDDGYQCAPTPVLQAHGRIWKAFATERRGQSFLISAADGDDLLNSASWTQSKRVAGDKKWLSGTFNRWEEGNAVLAPDGSIIDVTRVDASPPDGERAAIIHFDGDTRVHQFDPTIDFIRFPGGHKKFTIRFDPQTRKYWSLANWIPPQFAGGNVNLTRNTLALICSTNLQDWTVRSVVLQHPDPEYHAFQYVDWLFDGADLIAVSRTAFDDSTGGAHSAHDANFLTFHRLKNFRQQTEMPAATADVVHFANARVAMQGRRFDIAPLAEGAATFLNRSYVWNVIPRQFDRWHYTRTSGAGAADLTVSAIGDTTLWAAAANDAKNVSGLAGWALYGEQSFTYDDAHHTPMRVFRRPLRRGQTLHLVQQSWAGVLLLLPPDNDPAGDYLDRP